MCAANPSIKWSASSVCSASYLRMGFDLEIF